ncbi:uncharacterized protein LOC134188698 [Corticium candelabrum]|uniref:uncharacterized protein LOC134188698 n=1 Tax=Corticium candelabrum TaxID=121492 RepID=UPI002E26B8BE|nr:uncharacterized protein LOC134188698 [Corticium candelabrum]
MASFVCALLCAAVALHSAESRATLPAHAKSQPVEGQYIVVLHGNVSDYAREKHMMNVRSMQDAGKSVEVRFEYNIGSFKGYSGRMSHNLLNHVRNLPEVKYIEQDQTVHTINEQACVGETITDPGLWGLIRISHRDATNENEFIYDDANNGNGVTAYILDTGIYVQHNDFANRAEPGPSFVGTEPDSNDGNGHGTHVAATIMGQTYGIARQATAVAVKVLGSGGSGSYDGVIAGINHVAREGKKPGVANMSLGGGYSQAVNDAVDAAVDAGYVFSIAAGNSGIDACSFSPASATKAITVGSTDLSDARSYFSNTGNCMEIFAPGSNIKSAWIGGPTATNTISGTSMAAPHVAGVVAEYLSRNPEATPAQVLSALEESATPNIVSNPGTNSPNLLLYRACEE